MLLVLLLVVALGKDMWTCHISMLQQQQQQQGVEVQS
jgi:hypothetical protein